MALMLCLCVCLLCMCPCTCCQVLGEAMLRYHAVVHKLPSVAVRIGWLVDNDNPASVGAKETAFMRALYLSHRDAGGVFDAALSAPLPADVPFAMAYATSANGRSMLDVTESQLWLRYTSVDNAESFF